MIQIFLSLMALFGLVMAAQFMVKVELSLFDPSAFFITLFGVFFYAITIIGLDRFSELMRFLKTNLVRADFDQENRKAIEWLTELSWQQFKGKEFDQIPRELNDDFCRESFSTFKKGVLLPEMLKEILGKSAQTEYQRALLVRDKLDVLGRFIPTLSVLALVLAGLSKLSGFSDPLALYPMVGILKIAILTGIYTFILSFFVLFPVAECIGRTAEERDRKNKLLVEGLYRIARKENTIHILERLNALCPVEKRVRWEEMSFAKETTHGN